MRQILEITFKILHNTIHDSSFCSQSVPKQAGRLCCPLYRTLTCLDAKLVKTKNTQSNFHGSSWQKQQRQFSFDCYLAKEAINCRGKFQKVILKNCFCKIDYSPNHGMNYNITLLYAAHRLLKLMIRKQKQPEQRKVHLILNET